MKLEDRIGELLKQHGSYRDVGDAVALDPSYLYRLHKGKRTEPTDEALTKLGLERVVTYRRKKP